MPNEMKLMEKALIKERQEREPDAFERKNLIFWLLAAMVGTRALHSILNAGYCLIHGIDIPVFEYVMMLFMVLVALGFSHIIYSGGAMPAVYLALAGGVYSIIMAHSGGTFLMLHTGYTFLTVLTTIFIATIAIQIFAMAFISLDKKCRLYMRTMAEIRKELMIQVKSRTK